AVGMATRMPPHNLTEIIDALIGLVENPNLPDDELFKTVPGPDFPTAGFIYGREGIRQAYTTGRGVIQMRARAVIEKIAKGDREAIIVTELPYQVNKARLIESIAALVTEDKIEGIGDLRDESDREGMRIVIELKKGTVSAVVLNQLYKHTAMQSSFGIIMLAIVSGQPKILSLREFLKIFIEHRREVIVRRTVFELAEAERRAHILQGLKIAVENIDRVVELIKKSPNPAEAKKALMENFELTDIQAQAILDLRLQRLTGLERDKIVREYEEVLALINRLREILASDKLIAQIIVDELKEIRQKYGDKRRTEIVAGQTGDFSMEDLIQEEDMVVTVSHLGYIKRNPISLYRAQRRGGRGKTGMTTRDEDFVEQLFVASTHSFILIFTSRGKVHWLKVHEIPQAGRATRGKAISNLISLESDEKVATILPVKDFDGGKFVFFVTRKGTVKKTTLPAYSNPRAGGIIAITIEPDDELVEVTLCDGTRDILLSTAEGQTIRFKEEEVRPMGRSAGGVRGISLGEKDQVVGMSLVHSGANVLTVSEKGYGKRTDTGEYRLQGRGGSGIITMKTSEKTGLVIATLQVLESDDVMLITDLGKIIRIHVNQISVMGRNTQGVRLIQVEPGEKVVSAATMAEKDEENGEGGEEIASPNDQGPNPK
ncbi:MAG: DNA gyrase subunit A, partial [Deltaproteobacteria bacterium]|nr:DNA gyrase subunit A [Deltaproteobacteria bacterium]